MAVTKIADVIVPEIFTPYVMKASAEKVALIESGVVVRDPFLDNFLAGGGLTVNVPFWKDLDNDSENVSSDDDTVLSTPKKIKSGAEIAVRLSRNSSWSAMDLAADLAGSDPMNAIKDRIASYWRKRLQAMFIATMTGVFADNAAAPAGTEHVEDDLTLDISGSAYEDGVTNFSGAAFIDATLTMGDAQDQLGAIMVHSIVYGRMQKQGLIDFVADDQGRLSIPTYMGKRVIVDDAMPKSSGVFESWFFGADAVRMGMGTPQVPTEVERAPAAGNGGGQETIYSRVEWTLHPVGHAYVGTAPVGGPSNASTSNNLAHAGSWQRVYVERKQIKIARLITREY